jgi:uncharacterized protein (DUF433 family)
MTVRELLEAIKQGALVTMSVVLSHYPRLQAATTEAIRAWQARKNA